MLQAGSDGYCSQISKDALAHHSSSPRFRERVLVSDLDLPESELLMLAEVVRR